MSIHFPDLTPIDPARRCPKYTHICNKSAENGVIVEDLDDLQLELEELLVSATQRLKKISSELKSVADSHDKKDGKLFKGKDSDIKRQRPAVVDEKPPKKLKLQAEIMKPLQATVAASSPTSGARVKNKNRTGELEEDIPVAARPPGPEIPNKFWQMVDTYCGDVTPATIKFLEKLSKPLNKNDDIFQIPELGPHFSQQWSLEDIAVDKSDGKKNVEQTNENRSEIQQMMKRGYEAIQNSEPCAYGNITQRLISAFVDESIMVPPGSGPHVEGTRFESNVFGQMEQGSKTTKIHSIPHTAKLESRIKAELIEQGIMDSNTQESDDEILTELKRCQQELFAVSERNRTVSNQLLKLSKSEVKKQEVKKKVEVVNQEIIENYRHVVTARQKKRILMRKEKDSILKSIKERENLMKQLEQSM